MTGQILLGLSRRLLDVGFVESESTSDYRRLVRSASEMIQQEIAIELHSVPRQEVSIQLFISIKKLTNDEVYWECLMREFGTNGVFLLGAHQAKGWPINAEVEDVWSSVEKRALPWLVRHSGIDHLLGVLERLVTEGERCERPSPPRRVGQNWLARIFERNREKRVDVVHPPKYIEHLANLYLYVGDDERAKVYLRRWIEFARSHPETEIYRQRLSQLENV